MYGAEYFGRRSSNKENNIYASAYARNEKIVNQSTKINIVIERHEDWFYNNKLYYVSVTFFVVFAILPNNKTNYVYSYSSEISVRFSSPTHSIIIKKYRFRVENFYVTRFHWPREINRIAQRGYLIKFFYSFSIKFTRIVLIIGKIWFSFIIPFAILFAFNYFQISFTKNVYIYNYLFISLKKKKKIN